MQDSPAVPDVFGVIDIQLAAVLAVHVPEPEVRTEPPPPSFAKDRLVGLIAICAIAEAARQKVELILASAGEGVVGVDAEGTIIFINDAARDMLGNTNADAFKVKKDDDGNGHYWSYEEQFKQVRELP